MKKFIVLILTIALIGIVIISISFQCTVKQHAPESISGKTLVIPNVHFLTDTEYVYVVDSTFSINTYTTISDVIGSSERPQRKYLSFIKCGVPYNFKLWTFKCNSKTAFVSWYENKSSCIAVFAEPNKMILQSTQKFDSLTIIKLIKLFGK